MEKLANGKLSKWQIPLGLASIKYHNSKKQIKQSCWRLLAEQSSGLFTFRAALQMGFKAASLLSHMVRAYVAKKHPQKARQIREWAIAHYLPDPFEGKFA